MKRIVYHTGVIALLTTSYMAQAKDFYLVPPTLYFKPKVGKSLNVDSSFEVSGPVRAEAIIEDSSLSGVKSGILVIEGPRKEDRWEYSGTNSFTQGKSLNISMKKNSIHLKGKITESGFFLFCVLPETLPSIAKELSNAETVLEIPNVVKVKFPASSFKTSNNVEIKITRSQESIADFAATAGLIPDLGPRLPFEFKILTGDHAPGKDIELLIDIPSQFLKALPAATEFAAFIQEFEEEGEEILDHFQVSSSALTPNKESLRIVVPAAAFTKRRSASKKYEAIVIVGTILTPIISQGDKKPL